MCYFFDLRAAAARFFAMAANFFWAAICLGENLRLPLLFLAAFLDAGFLVDRVLAAFLAAVLRFDAFALRVLAAFLAAVLRFAAFALRVLAAFLAAAFRDFAGFLAGLRLAVVRFVEGFLLERFAVVRFVVRFADFLAGLRFLAVFFAA